MISWNALIRETLKPGIRNNGIGNRRPYSNVLEVANIVFMSENVNMHTYSVLLITRKSTILLKRAIIDTAVS